MTTRSFLPSYQATCVAVEGRALIIQGPPGIGKSSLALALIDRGAELIGDDSIVLEANDGRLMVRPHPNTCGLLEVRNLGLLPFPFIQGASAALVIYLDPNAPRYVEQSQTTAICGIRIPLIGLRPEGPTLAVKAELAMRHYGSVFD